MILHVIRTQENLKNKNSDSYLRAIKKRAEKEGVEVSVLTNNPYSNNPWNEKEIRVATSILKNVLVLEPCEFEFKRELTLDGNLTSKAIFNLIEEFNKEREVDTVAILNRSSLIGRPLHEMLLQADYTPFMLHSKTDKDYKKELLCLSDIVVSATGTDMTEFFDEAYNEYFNIIDVSNDYRDDRILKLADQTEIGKRTLDLLFKELVDEI